MGIPVLGLWCLGTVAGEGRVVQDHGDMAASPSGAVGPDPATPATRTAPVQRSPWRGCGVASIKSEKKILKGKLQRPFAEVWVVFVTTCAWH